MITPHLVMFTVVVVFLLAWMSFILGSMVARSDARGEVTRDFARLMTRELVALGYSPEVNCTSCGASMQMHGAPKHEWCPDCNGSGVYVCSRVVGDNGVEAELASTCETCDGKATVLVPFKPGKDRL